MVYLFSRTVLGFPGGSDGKESACNVGDLGSIPGLGKSPGGGNGNLLYYSCLENPHGQRSLAGYSSWGHKESDMTERLSTHSAQGYPNKVPHLGWLQTIGIDSVIVPEARVPNQGVGRVDSSWRF